MRSLEDTRTVGTATHIYDHPAPGLCLLYEPVEVEGQPPAKPSHHTLNQLRLVLPQPTVVLYVRIEKTKIYAGRQRKKFTITEYRVSEPACFWAAPAAGIFYPDPALGKSSVSDPDPHKDMPPVPRIRIQEVKKPRKCSDSLGQYRTGNIKARILL